jgi:hypothetical protein
MTAIPAPRAVARELAASITPLDRALLLTATALDALVSARLLRRASVEHRRAVAVQTARSDARRSAEALGAAGMLPR